mgnify:FL=1
MGCNFDILGHFHKAYCYAGATSRNFVRDMFQSLYRVRHFVDDELVYFLDTRHMGMNLPTSKQRIEDCLKNKTALIEKQYQDQLQLTYSQATPEWLSELIAYNTFEYNMGIMNMEQLFQRYLKECNYVHQIQEEPDILIGIDLDLFLKPSLGYTEIPEITSSQMKDLRIKRIAEGLDDKENAQWEKFWFQMCVLDLPKDVEQPLWEIYCNFNKGKFRNMCVEKGLEEGSVRIEDLLHCHTYSALNDGYTLRVQMIEDIKKWLGIKNTQQYGEKITKDKIQSVLDQFLQKKHEIHVVFDLNKDRSKKFDVQTCQKMINKVFRKWGFSQLKKDELIVRKRVNGKRVDLTPYVLEVNEICKDDIDIYKYIKPKVVPQRDIKVRISKGTNPLND